MSTENQVLLSNITAEAADSTYVYGSKQPGAGYHKRSDSMHTATYSVNSFVGAIKLQATLALYPEDSDWFDIDGTDIGLGSDSSAWTTTNSINFTGNFVWLRAAYNLQNGTITEIRYNY
jgi:hypothetical protein